ncbi:MAG: Circadian clock protein kinase KaiC [Thermoanaerobacterales bacterium 50_218]|nr:MAG: Circadian clock protein kinase KaiC [Thermoanaerobacterales bacterium 50_218]HAA89189.1 hypothetical protein [Peptococcaceae bacterium]
MGAKVRTGIAGLDDLFYGGILEGNIILLEGIPGAGKTTLFIYRGIEKFNEPGIILTFEQFPEALYRDASNFGWDLRNLERCNKLRVVCTSPETVLSPESVIIEEAVREIGARRLLVDSVSHFHQVIAEPLKLRQAFYSFCNGLRRLGLTPLLVKEQRHTGESDYSFEEFIVDVVILLDYASHGPWHRQRNIEVVKSRGQAHVPRKHSLQIGEKGARVFVLNSLISGEIRASWRPLVKTGIEGLDEVLGGGFPRGASILVHPC